MFSGAEGWSVDESAGGGRAGDARDHAGIGEVEANAASASPHSRIMRSREGSVGNCATLRNAADVTNDPFV
jgi:hypothetical protein